MTGKLVLFIAVFLGAAAVFGPAQAEEYRLGAGDVLSISVWGFDDITVKEVKIRPDGKIAVPLAGEMAAAGLSAGELSESLAAALAKYIKDPKVTVNILKFRTTRVYVLGEIAKPGLYELEKGHNLLDAVGAAGGYTKNTAKKSVVIIRSRQQESPVKVNLLKLLKDGDVSQNCPLGEGDVIYFSDNGRVDFARDILPFLTGAYYLTHFTDK